MSGTKVLWQWDPVGGVWLRTQDDQPHVDASGTRIAPANVVVMSVRVPPQPGRPHLARSRHRRRGRRPGVHRRQRHRRPLAPARPVQARDAGRPGRGGDPPHARPYVGGALASRRRQRGAGRRPIPPRCPTLPGSERSVDHHNRDRSAPGSRPRRSGGSTRWISGRASRRRASTTRAGRCLVSACPGASTAAPCSTSGPGTGTTPSRWSGGAPLGCWPPTTSAGAAVGAGTQEGFNLARPGPRLEGGGPSHRRARPLARRRRRSVRRRALPRGALPPAQPAPGPRAGAVGDRRPAGAGDRGRPVAGPPAGRGVLPRFGAGRRSDELVGAQRPCGAGHACGPPASPAPRWRGSRSTAFRAARWGRNAVRTRSIPPLRILQQDRFVFHAWA